MDNFISWLQQPATINNNTMLWFILVGIYVTIGILIGFPSRRK